MQEVYEAFMLGGQEIERLRKENENLKTSLDESQEVVVDLKREIKELEEEANKLTELWNKEVDKRRKATEYINYFGTTPEENDNTVCRHILKSLLNILNGRSDE